MGYSPTALSIAHPDDGWRVSKTEKGEQKHVGYLWPGVIRDHIDWWASKPDARDYASDDIKYTRELWEQFEKPAPDDDDSVLACMVGVVRWKGFKIDTSGMEEMLAESKALIGAAPVNINKPSDVRRYVTEMMDETESLILAESTRQANLIAVSEWIVEEAEDCARCSGVGCPRCQNTGTLQPGEHLAAFRAQEVLKTKYAAKERELFRKLLKAGKLHASFNVVGTLSSRMSGGDGLNAQGIKHTKEIRRLFPLAWEDMTLCGGDFDSFEVTLADAVYDDENLPADLLSGKKIHALFAQAIYPGFSYEDVLASKDTEDDKYTKGKSGVFAMIYGGNESTLVRNLGINEDLARAAFENFDQRYPGVGKARSKTFDKVCSMRQPGGIGSRVIWADPAEYVESFLGFRR